MYLLKNLISLTTLETDRTEVQNNTFNMTDLIKNVVNPFSPAARSKNICLSFSIDESIPESMIGDDEVSLKLIKLLCRHNGFEISTASSGKEALDLFCGKNFNIVFMDIQMPDMSGIEVARRMREMKPFEDNKTAIIAVTAYVLKGDREKFLAHGMDDYISKPIYLQQFNDLMKKWAK
jgi:CheY-like chemotaxis protein